MNTAHIVVDLGYGDAGKGSWVDHVVDKHNIEHVIRFNGGAQALHHVVTPEGLVHGFAQFGSGTLIPDTKTYLSRFMLVEPLALMCEAEVLTSKGVYRPCKRMYLSENAPVIPYFNILLNRIMEQERGNTRHGSCGFGIGLTQGDVEELGSDALYMHDLCGSHTSLCNKLTSLHKLKLDAVQECTSSSYVEEMKRFDIENYADTLMDIASMVHVVTDEYIGSVIADNDTVFEGAQGVLLDQSYGFFPHCTRSNTTFENAFTLLEDAEFAGTINRIGLLRGYATRHGAGPFVTEDKLLDIPVCHNKTGEWQGAFRHGWFDTVMARYALGVVDGVDELVLTNLDRLNGLESLQVATSYSHVDERFFEQGDMKVDQLDYTTLAQRTATLDRIQPVYTTLDGWRTTNDEEMYTYVNTLSDMLDTRISALSLRPDRNKVYL